MSDTEEPATRRSSRSRVKSSKHAGALEKLKQVRAEGRVHRENVDELTPDLYEEINEDEYVEKYGEDDFVVDDDGSGYVDHGQEDDEDPYYAADEKEQKKKERRAGKVKKGAMDNFLCAVIPSKKESEHIATEKVDEDLNAMLAEIAQSDILDDLNHEREPDEEFLPVPNKFKRNRPFSPDNSAFTPPSKLPRKQIKLTKKAQPTLVQKSPAVQHKPHASNFDDNDDYDFDSNDFDDVPSSPPPRPVISKKDESVLSTKFNRELSFEEEKQPEVPKKVFETAKKNDISQLNFDNSKLIFFDEEEEAPPAPVVITDSDVSKTGYFKESRSIRFYWFDAYEDSKHPGKVYLFGFVKKDAAFEFESCCVTIDKILHRVFFVKRDCLPETNETISDYMVYEEVNLLMKNYKIPEFKSRPAIKKFAFMDGETPDEAACLEVLYDSAHPSLPPGPYNGKTFNRIANASVTAMERLLVEREIRGPCWLEITDVDEVRMGEKVSYCQREFKAVVSKVELDLVNVMPNMQNAPLPPCRMMAINIITVACPKTNKPHIVLMTVLRSSTYYLDRQTPTRWDQRMTYIAPPPGATFPLQLQQDIDRRKLQIEKCVNEKSMLQKFLGIVKLFDPDVVLGHDIAAQMSILRDRLEDNKLVTINWSFMGRLKRHENLKHVPQNKNFRWSWTAGRLYLDSKSAAMELVHSQSYDLEELVAKIVTPVDPNAKRLPVDTEMISRVFYENGGKTDPIFNLIQWSLFDAHYSHQILVQLNAMQLFLQITQIVGGVLSRTLLGGRAERNEYLLLHAFFRDGFVAPDRVSFKPKTKQVTQEIANESSAAVEGAPQQQQPTSKKAQYTGGLVLEPKKGLYETFIVLLDFNSLYPSIIQEFNICFTTVKLEQTKEANESDLPPIPDSCLEPGILPKEISKLVRTRRDIKQEMSKLQDKKCERYKQYDIRQLGLKLTANSMYGCLGFEGSRFCAKTLAAMITSKGREILESTRTLVENKGYSVIYGDTDSIMVNTNSIILTEAKQIGYTIKQLINKSYKQLTLDIDGVYKRLLLLKKKKYAGLAIDLSNELKISKELKGLDIVRRDWSFLAREVGDKVVDIILQSNGRDEMVEEIRKTLTAVKEGIEQRTIPLEKFEILKKLTHRPEDYRDAKSQPHVLVALRLNQTKNTNYRQNDIVKYVICDDGSGQAATQRAYARIEIEANNELKIDSTYYLAHQIHPVVSRLCEPIEEMDACQVAEALGLDGTHYRRRLIEQVDDDANDENAAPGIIFNFNACDGLPIQCPSCKHINIHRSFLNDDKKPSLSECSSCHYCLLNDPVKVELQIIGFLQKCCKKYSECKYVCDDVICGFELDFPPVFKNEFGFPCTECSHGFFKPSYTIKRLYDQQNFVLKIVNFDEWETNEATKEQKDTVNAWPKVAELRLFSKEWTKRISKFIHENSYNRVDLSLVFAPMKIF